MTNERIEIAIAEMETLHKRVQELEAEIVDLRAENLKYYNHAVTARIGTLRDLWSATEENKRLAAKLEKSGRAEVIGNIHENSELLEKKR